MYKFLFHILFCKTVFATVHHVPQLVNKYYIYEQLKLIYGEEANSILKKNILANTKVFAGACDPYAYESQGSNENGVEFQCFNGISSIKANSHSKTSVIRELILEKTCEKLVNLKNIKRSKFSKAVTYDEFNKHYKEFIPHKDLNKKVYESIRIQKINRLSQWKLFSKVVCRSLEWQKI